MTDAYADFKDDAIPSNLETVLVQLADELVAAYAKVEEAERVLEEAKDAVKELAENRIPNATEGMDGVLKLKDGRTLELKTEIRASIAGEKKEPAIQWINDHDYGHIVKRELVFNFGKDKTDEVNALKKAIAKFQKKTGTILNMKDNDSVHHQTLLAWVKEQLGDGVDLPKDIFGIYRQRTAKVKE